ncbi:hypothetical protein [Nocardia sp. CA-119907]|uniref:hypothetical protein n=1 Tax=Nocardia sp. CA-119907 TaxID=3239973 RepID=UPI003D9793C0
MSTAWTLHATGRQTPSTWPQLAATTTHAAWADTDGFHITPALPDTPPATTHLWAWTTGCWIRARIDHTDWWAAALTHNATPTGPLWAKSEALQHVTIQPILHWPPGAGEVQQRHLTPADALTSYRMIQLAPTRATTATFLGTLDTDPTARPVS